VSNQNVPCRRTNDERGGAKEKNQNALTTGHRQAQVALEKDAPFSSLALAKQQEIQDRIHNEGLAAELHHRATRTCAVADLMFESLCIEWPTLNLKGKFDYSDRYSRMEARAVKALQTAGDMNASRPDRAFPDIVDIEVNDGNGNPMG